MAVAAADEEQRADGARIEDLSRLAESAMIAVIEADAHQGSGGARGVRHDVQLTGAACARLFDEHMLAGPRGFRGNGGQHVVSRGDHHYIDSGAGCRSPPVRSRLCAWMRRSQGLGARRITIAADSQPGAPQRLGALRPDQAAADDRNIEGHPGHTC